MSNNARDEDIEECIRNFYRVATLQGRIAYLFMSIHAINPAILNSILPSDPYQILWANMMYGTTLHLYARPNMRNLNTFHRSVFAFGGSIMFNCSVMKVFAYFNENLDERPIFMTFLGFVTSRIMLLYFLAYLYHVDSREPGLVRRNSWFDSMYN